MFAPPHPGLTCKKFLMLRNYFKIAWRNLLKNKTFSAINIFGLAIGIAAFLLIVNYLRFEYSFDSFNTKENRIFRVPMTITETGGKQQTFAFTFPALAPAMKKDYPEVEEAVRFRRVWGVVTHGDKKFIENGKVYYVDPSVFNVFSFNFEKGTAATALHGLNDAVITRTTAKKYFGDEDPVGQPLHYNNEDYIVSAVLDDVPANSHIQFNILLNFNKYIQLTNGRSNTSWGWSDFYTYLLLAPGTQPGALQAKMPAFAERYMGRDMKKDGFKTSFQIQPLKDIHTRSTYAYEMTGSGNLYYLKYLGMAALLILSIALVNYINLSTARSLERSKEVGLRKVVGASRLQLIRQFLIESMLLNAFGIFLGFLIFKLSLPSFSRLIGHELGDLQVYDGRYWMTLLMIFLVSTFLAGFYPSFVLSSFQPVQSIKSFSISRGQGKAFLRRSLVVFQFTAAIVLIGGAIGFYRQLRFMREFGAWTGRGISCRRAPELGGGAPTLSRLRRRLSMPDEDLSRDIQAAARRAKTCWAAFELRREPRRRIPGRRATICSMDTRPTKATSSSCRRWRRPWQPSRPRARAPSMKGRSLRR